MLTEAQIIAKLKDTGVTASYLMQHLGLTHMKATAMLQALGAHKSQTGVPCLWRIGPKGSVGQEQWVKGPRATA